MPIDTSPATPDGIPTPTGGQRPPPTWGPAAALDTRYRVESVADGLPGPARFRATQLDWRASIALRPLWPAVVEGREVPVDWPQGVQLDAWCDLAPYPHLVGCYYTAVIDGWRCLVEEATSGALLLPWSPSPDEGCASAVEAAIEVAWALHQLHQAGITYGPIAPADVLICDDGTVRLRGPSKHPGRDADAQAADVCEWGFFLARLLGIDPSGGSMRGTELHQYALQVFGRIKANPFNHRSFSRRLELLFWGLLQADPKKRSHDILAAADSLHEAYEILTGHSLPRKRPTPDPVAEGNKRALCLLERAPADPEAALSLWEALAASSPPAAYILYNQTLLGLRTGRIEPPAIGSHFRSRLPPQAPGGDYLQALLECEAGLRLADLDTLRRALPPSGNPFHNGIDLDPTTPVDRTITRRRIASFRDGVYRLRHLPGPQVLLIGREGGTLVFFDLARGQEMATVEAHSGGVRALSRLSDPGTFLTGGGDATIALWDLAGQQRLATLESDQTVVNAVDIFADGTRAVSGGNCGIVRVWDLATGQVQTALEAHRTPVNTLILFDQDRRLLSAGSDRTLKVWDIATGECLHTMTGHRNVVSAVAISADGRLAVSGSWDRDLRIWDLETGASLKTLSGHQGWISSVAIAPALGCAISCSSTGEMILWDMETHTIRAEFDSEHGAWVNHVEVAGDCASLFAASSRGYVEQLDPPRTARFRAPYCLSDSTGRGAAPDLPSGFSLEAARAAVQAGDPMRAYRNLRIERERAPREDRLEIMRYWSNLYRYLPVTGYRGVWARVILGTRGEEVIALAASPNGRFLFGGCKSGRILRWDIQSGTVAQIGEGHTGAVTSLAVSADGQLLLSGSRDFKACLWDLKTGKLRLCTAHDYAVTAVALTRDGRCAASGSLDKSVRCWEVDTGKMQCVFSGHHRSITAVAISPDDSQLLSVGVAGSLKLWNLPCGDEVRSMHAPLSETSACFTPDGRHVLSGGYDNVLHLWELESGNVVRRFRGHTARISGVALSPDGNYGLSVADDNTVRIWSVALGDCLDTLEADVSPANCLVLDPLLRFVASGTRHDKLAIWMLDWYLGRPRTPIPQLSAEETQEGLLAAMPAWIDLNH